MWDTPIWFLTDLPLDKIAAISQTIFSDVFLWMKSFVFWWKISLKFVPRSPVDNKSALVRKWLGAEEATSHYLNQCSPSSLAHICGTRGRWDKLQCSSYKLIPWVFPDWPHVNATEHTIWKIDICSGNGLVPPSSKPYWPSSVVSQDHNMLI